MGRRDRNIAKIEIYSVFQDFISHGNYKATVSSIVDATGMNRKTFYNHFSSRDELVAWGFRYDMYNMLLQHYAMEELVDPPQDIYGFENLPCYHRNQVSALSLDQSDYFRDFYNTIRDKKEYYRPLSRSDFAYPFARYLVDLFRGLFYEDIRFFLNGRRMPEEAMRFIASFYAEGVVHHIIDSLAGATAPRFMIETLAPVNNLVHVGMYEVVESYQKEKSYLYFSRTRDL